MSGRKSEIVEQLETLLHNGDAFEVKSPQIVELRTEFVNLVKAAHAEEKKNFLESEGEEVDFKPSHDEFDGKFADEMAKYNQLKKSWEDQRAHELTQNLETKKKIVQTLSKLVEEEDHIGPAFAKFNELKEQWKNTGNVPAKDFKELQQEYSHQIEKFFYNINIYKTLKAYDLEKNLKLKQDLIEKVKKLHANKSIKEVRELIAIYVKDWDEIGPTHQTNWEEVRDHFWGEVKSIHKKIADHYKELKERYHENFEAKEKLCKEVESLANEEYPDIKKWNQASKRVEKIRLEWKKIGFAGKNKNDQVWEQFRNLTNAFFEKRKPLQADLKDEYKENERRKTALIEKASAIQESVDWRNTAEEFKKLQGQWKRIGPASPGKEQKLWNRFRATSDHFFNARKAFFDGREDREKNNLKLKNEILKKLEKVSPKDGQKAMAEIESLGKEWNAIGHVPMAEKQKITSAYDHGLKSKLEQIGLSRNEVEEQTFSMKVEGLKESDNAEVLLEKEHYSLAEKLKKVESQIKQYENNLGFFGGNIEGNPLLKEVQQNIESAKKEAEGLRSKMKQLNK